jgi:hypothetical protein
MYFLKLYLSIQTLALLFLFVGNGTISLLFSREIFVLIMRKNSVAAGPPWGSARELSLSPLTWRGDPPPPGPGEGDATTPYSRS